MKLLIHDMNKTEWEKVRDRYDGWEIISDDGTIKPCVGCFSCWIKTPGQCVIKDGYHDTPEKIHRADEVVISTRYTYGCFGSFVKNVVDRSIGYVLPFFEIVNNEMHHKSRYPGLKKMTFIFRGNDLSEEDKQKAKDYVRAVGINLKADIQDVIFEPCEDEAPEAAQKEITADSGSKKIVAVNCSLRGDNANSKKFLDRFVTYLDEPVETVNLAPYLLMREELVKLLLSGDTMILAMPLYVDGIPSAALRIMEDIERSGCAQGKRVYIIANMGFYESTQLKNLMSQAKEWCNKCDMTYGGVLAIGAGEMLGGFMASEDIAKGPAKNVAKGFEDLAAAVNGKKCIDEIHVMPAYFPRILYMFAANMGWPKGIKENGLKKKDLYRQL